MYHLFHKVSSNCVNSKDLGPFLPISVGYLPVWWDSPFSFLRNKCGRGITASGSTGSQEQPQSSSHWLSNLWPNASSSESLEVKLKMLGTAKCCSNVRVKDVLPGSSRVPRHNRSPPGAYWNPVRDLEKYKCPGCTPSQLRRVPGWGSVIGTWFSFLRRCDRTAECGNHSLRKPSWLPDLVLLKY